jgi:hypothetical protein
MEEIPPKSQSRFDLKKYMTLPIAINFTFFQSYNRLYKKIKEEQ